MVSLFLFFEWWEGGNWEKIPFVFEFWAETVELRTVSDVLVTDK